MTSHTPGERSTTGPPGAVSEAYTQILLSSSRTQALLVPAFITLTDNIVIIVHSTMILHNENNIILLDKYNAQLQRDQKNFLWSMAMMFIHFFVPIC